MADKKYNRHGSGSFKDFKIDKQGRRIPVALLEYRAHAKKQNEMLVLSMLQEGHKVEDIARTLGTSVAAVRKVVKELGLQPS